MRTHIFIFVRHCDLHFTLLLDLFRQVKANKLLMNKSVKYSPPSQLPIQMLLISPGFLCCVQLQGARFGHAGKQPGQEISPHSQGCQERGWGQDQRKAGESRVVSSWSLVQYVQAWFTEGTTSWEGLHFAYELRGPAKKPGPEPSLSFSDTKGRYLTRKEGCLIPVVLTSLLFH